MNAYVVAFVAACITYALMVSSIKKEDPEGVNMEAIMYSAGAGAIGFAVVHFLALSDVTMTESTVPKPVAVSKPANAVVGITGETIMTDAFPSTK
jgi:hypothetical protein